jgi:hypothetical protein
MRIAYLLLAHNKIDQVFNLVRCLNYPDNGIFIHIKEGVNFEIPDDIQKMSNVHFATKRYLAGWCGFSVIMANLHLLELAMNSIIQYDYFINLSGSCFPMYSNEYIASYLEKNQYIYIEGHKLPYDKLTKGGLAKILYPWYQDKFQNLNPYVKKLFHKIIHIPYLVFSVHRKTPKQIDQYFGSQWWAITFEVANLVLKSAKENPTLLKFYKKCWCTDEQYFQTVIFNTPELKDKIKNGPFRYIDWNTNGPPKTLVVDDYQKLIDSKFLFARKFDSVLSKDLIDLIYKNINK